MLNLIVYIFLGVEIWPGHILFIRFKKKKNLSVKHFNRKISDVKYNLNKAEPRSLVETPDT